MEFEGSGAVGQEHRIFCRVNSLILDLKEGVGNILGEGGGSKILEG